MIDIRKTVALTLCGWLLAHVMFGPKAGAQTVPGWMKVSAAYVLSSEAVVRSAQPQDLELSQSSRRGAYMLAAGMGLVAAGVLVPSLINDRRCEGSPVYKASIPGGVTVGVGGLVLAAVGIYKLRKQGFAERQFRRGDTAGFIFTSLGTAAVASGALAAISASQIVACIE